jgi:cytochrome c-type biogenesis protein CcmH
MSARRSRFFPLAMLVVAGILALTSLPLYAQDDEAPVRPVTNDDVNRVASQLFCPVCEHLPLDVCPEPTCVQWRAEIRGQLEQGRSDREIIDFFVDEYGDRVVGIPQNPLLRAVSLAGPVAVVIFGLIAGVWTFLRWRDDGDDDASPPEDTATSPDEGNDEYRSRLESDLGYKS